MKILHRFLLFPLMLAAMGIFEVEPVVSPPEPPTPPAPPAPPAPPVGLTDEMKTFIASQVEAARNETKAELEAAAERERTTKETEEREKRERDAGNFETIEQGLKGQITELSGYKERTEVLETRLTAQYETDAKELPAVILAFKPKDDASLETKLDWLETAKAQAANVAPPPGRPGLRSDPTKPAPTDKVKEDVARQDARSAIRRSI